MKNNTDSNTNLNGLKTILEYFEQEEKRKDYSKSPQSKIFIEFIALVEEYKQSKSLEKLVNFLDSILDINKPIYLEKQTIIHIATKLFSSIPFEVFELIMSKNPNLEAKDDSGYTPLLNAIEASNVEQAF